MARLGDICEKVTDYVASGSFAALKENVLITNEENYAIMVKTADFSNGFTKGLTYTDKHGYDFLRNSNLFGGELILSNIGSIGKVFKVPYLDCPMTLASNTVMIKTATPELTDYLYYYFLSPAGYKKLLSISSGTSMLKFNKTELKKLEVPVPNVDRQRHIIAVMDKVAELIAIRKEQLAKLDQLVKSRFVDMFGTVKNNHQRYPVVRIGDCAKLQGGFAFKSSDYIDDGIRLVQISNVNKDTLNWDSINYVPQAFLQKYKDFELHIGDLVLAMTRPVIKSLDAVKIARVSEYDVPSLLNQRVGRFVIDKAKLNVVYLMSCCQMTEFREYVEAMSGNSLQPNISSKQVENYSIILPPLELQEQFAAFVEQTNKLKLAIQQSLDKLEVLKKTLMQEYFG